MDTVELASGANRAIVTRHGAWLMSLADEHGDIVFPKQWIEAGSGKRARGGSHVCLPNFGPGGGTGLAQHGFGRTATWNVTERGVASVTMQLIGGVSDYGSLVSNLTYTLAEKSLSMKLTVTNNGNAPLRIAPGFHPYFALTTGEAQVTVDDELYELSALAGTVFVEGSRKQLTTRLRRITLSAENLTTWAIWTDKAGQYVCVEPTFAGNAFLNMDTDEDETLRTGLSKTYKLTINW